MYLHPEKEDQLHRHAFELATALTLKALVSLAPASGEAIRTVVEEQLRRITSATRSRDETFESQYLAALDDQIEFIFGPRET